MVGISTLVGGGLALGGALLSSSSQKKAANTAAQASTYAADKSAAVQREQLQVANGALSPYVQRGNAAGEQINALLGLGGPAPMAANNNALAPMQPQAMAPMQEMTRGQWLDQNPQVGPQSQFTMYDEFRGGGDAYAPPGAYAANGQTTYAPPTQQPMQQQPMQGNPQQNAFDVFRNSTGYQFRLGEGMNALNSGYAAAGTLQSGAAMKDALRYGQDFASNEFGNYMAYLGNQQGVGFGGASALAGVGQNYANSISAINDNRASAIGNAALVKGQNNPFANALGTIGGGLMGRYA